MLELQDYSITDLIFLWHKFPNALLTFSLFGGRQQIFYRIISCPPPPPLLPPLSILSSGEAACREKWKLARTKSPARPPLKQIVGHHPDSVGIPWQIQPKNICKLANSTKKYFCQKQQKSTLTWRCNLIKNLLSSLFSKHKIASFFYLSFTQLQLIPRVSDVSKNHHLWNSRCSFEAWNSLYMPFSVLRNVWKRIIVIFGVFWGLPIPHLNKLLTFLLATCDRRR